MHKKNECTQKMSIIQSFVQTILAFKYLKMSQKRIFVQCVQCVHSKSGIVHMRACIRARV